MNNLNVDEFGAPAESRPVAAVPKVQAPKVKAPDLNDYASLTGPMIMMLGVMSIIAVLASYYAVFLIGGPFALFIAIYIMSQRR